MRKPTHKMTKEGLQKLEDELKFLRSTKRQEVTENLKIALSFGDLSENSEYDEARAAQEQLEIRISQIEEMLSNVEIIDGKYNKDHVNIGCKVKLEFSDSDDEEDYTIVGKTEANPSSGKISYESPIGSAILNKKVGDTVKVSTPSGTIQIKIKSIT